MHAFAWELNMELKLLIVEEGYMCGRAFFKSTSQFLSGLFFPLPVNV
jgi:hypothetical protein